MKERIDKEIEMLCQRYPKLEFIEDGYWVRIPSYPLLQGWNRFSTEIAFQIPMGYPGTPPYGIYALAGLLFNESKPQNYTEPAPNQPPFSGLWGIFSWSPANGQWHPTADIITGFNLINWVIGFATRFREGL